MYYFVHLAEKGQFIVKAQNSLEAQKYIKGEMNDPLVYILASIPKINAEHLAKLCKLDMHIIKDYGSVTRRNSFKIVTN